MTKNITKMLRDRETSGKKLSKYNQVLPNRYEVYFQKNRNVRQELVWARQDQLQARDRYTWQTGRVTRAIERGQPINALMELVEVAREDVEETTRVYDGVVQKARDVMKEWELFMEHYRASYNY